VNNLSQIVAGILFVSSAVIAFLISQPDVAFSPGIRLILGAANVAVTAMALYLKVQLPGQSRPS
jgi:hypothetical protein